MQKNGLACLLVQIAGAVVFAAVVTLLVVNGADIFYGKEESTRRGYTVDIANTPAATATAETGGSAAAAGAEPKKVDITPYLAKADLALGAKIIKRCETCHTFEKGKPGSIGPNQYGLVGRKVASTSFDYSSAMKAKGGTWTPQALSDFLTNPQAVVPGTKMGFAGLQRPEERAAIIAYINQNFSDKPLNLKASK